MAKIKRVSPIRALLADYYTKQIGEKVNLHTQDGQQKLDNFLQSHKSELLKTFAPEIKNKQTVKEILQLYTRDEWAELLIGLRQKQGLEKVPLKDVLSMIEYDGAHGYKLINGHADDFIKSTIHQHKYQIDLGDMKVPGIDHTIHHQLDTWVAELVSNALDATVPEQSIGKFGSGFLSCLSTLGKEADMITIITKKQGGDAYKLIFSQQKGEIFVATSRIDESSEIAQGTTIIMQRNGVPIDDEALMKQLAWKFSTNTTAPIIINNSQINNTDTVRWSKETTLYSQKAVTLEVNSSAVIVKDAGVGMDAHGLLYHLMFPKSGTKNPVSYTSNQLDSIIQKETRYGYITGDSETTKVRCQVAGVAIESFDIPKQGNIDELSVIFPSVSYLPEARNQIIGTREIILTLQHILRTIADSSESLQMKCSLLGSFAHVIRVIDERRTTEGQAKDLSLIKFAQKEIYPLLQSQISHAGKKPLQADKALKGIIGDTDNFIFIDKLFLGQINPLDLPGVQKIDSIILEKNVTQKVHGKDIPFYSCAFDQSSPHDYVIFSHCIVINDKYINDDENLSLINTSVNMNIGYELEEEKVYYGTIVKKANSKTGVVNSHDDEKKEERKEEIKEDINTPEMIDRYYKEIVDQIDIEYDGLWSLLKEYNHMCDHEAEVFYSDKKLDQYLQNDKTKERGMQMLMWCMTGMSGPEIDDVTIPLPENCKHFINFMKTQSAEHTCILQRFINYWANSIPYESDGGHSSYEEIAQFFKICGEETNPAIVKQLMEIIKRYKWNEVKSLATMDIFKKLNDWKGQSETVEDTKRVLKFGLFYDNTFDPIEADLGAGNVKEGNNSFTVGRSLNKDPFHIRIAFNSQGMEIIQCETLDIAKALIRDRYLNGGEINKENINAFFDRIGHHYPGYQKCTGQNNFSTRKNRYVWLPIQVHKEGLLYLESLEASDIHNPIRVQDQSYDDAYPILSEKIVEEVIEQQPTKKETIEGKSKRISFIDEYSGGGEYKELEFVWDLITNYSDAIGLRDSEEDAESASAELRKYGIDITQVPNADLYSLLDSVHDVDFNKLYREFHKGGIEALKLSHKVVNTGDLTKAHEVEGIEQGIIYQFLLYKKYQNDPILVKLEKRPTDRGSTKTDIRELKSLMSGKIKSNIGIDKNILEERIGKESIENALGQPYNDYVYLWNSFKQYDELEQNIILERLLSGYDGPNNDKYNIKGHSLNHERRIRVFLVDAPLHSQLSMQQTRTLIRLLNEIELMKKEYEEAEPEIDTPPSNEILIHGLDQQVAYDLCDHLFDIAGFTPMSIPNDEALTSTQREIDFSDTFKIKINRRKFALENKELLGTIYGLRGKLIRTTIERIYDKYCSGQNINSLLEYGDPQEKAAVNLLNALLAASSPAMSKMEKKEQLLENGWIYVKQGTLNYFLDLLFYKNGLSHTNDWDNDDHKKYKDDIFSTYFDDNMFSRVKVDVPLFAETRRKTIKAIHHHKYEVALQAERFSSMLLYLDSEQQKAILGYLKTGDSDLVQKINNIISDFNSAKENQQQGFNLTKIDKNEFVILYELQHFFACMIQDKIEEPLALTEKSLLDRYFESGVNDTLGSTVYLEKLMDVIFYRMDDEYVPQYITGIDEIAKIFDLNTLISAEIHSVYNEIHQMGGAGMIPERIKTMCFLGNEMHMQLKNMGEDKKRKIYSDILNYNKTEDVDHLLDSMLNFGQLPKLSALHYYVRLEQAILKGNQKKITKSTPVPKPSQKKPKKSPEQFFAGLYQEYPQDLVAFAQFLYSGGAFLGDIESETIINSPSKKKQFLLSELIATSNTQVQGMQNISHTKDLDTLIAQTRGEGLHSNWYHQRIRSAIDGQDRGSMIFLREVVQNARDVVLKRNKTSTGKSDIDLSFGKEGDFWMTKIKDPIGMSPFEVWNYLLPIFVSGKAPGESTGMFGQGFYSTMVGAKEVRIKTSKGNGETLYVTMKPIYQHTGNDIQNNQIIDFTIDTKTLKENYTGTTIERIDQQEGVMSNLIAMLGVNQLQKYVGAIDDVPVNFNGNPLLKPGSKRIEQSVDVPGYGVLELTRMTDGVQRVMKDNLYIKDIDDELLDIFPHWITKVIKDHQLLINLPTGISLNKTRNDLMHKDQMYKDIIQPHLFKVVIEYILNQFCHHGLKIPMLPEDYLYSVNYKHSEANNSDIFEMVSEYNISNKKQKNQDWSKASPRQNKKHLLKNNEFMAAFLVGADFTNNNVTTSLKEMRNQMLAKRSESIRSANLVSGRLQHKVQEAESRIRGKDVKMKDPNIDLAKDFDLPQERIDAFFSYQQDIADRLFGKAAGKVEIKHRLMENESTIADYATFFREVCWNTRILAKNKGYFMNFDKPNSPEQRAIVETLSHELAHHAETLFYNKRSTHEKDLETDSSFESLQRTILTKMLRGESFDIQEN